MFLFRKRNKEYQKIGIDEKNTFSIKTNDRIYIIKNEHDTFEINIYTLNKILDERIFIHKIYIARISMSIIGDKDGICFYQVIVECNDGVEICIKNMEYYDADKLQSFFVKNGGTTVPSILISPESPCPLAPKQKKGNTKLPAYSDVSPLISTPHPPFYPPSSEDWRRNGR